jgi:hypothetical protein
MTPTRNALVASFAIGALLWTSAAAAAESGGAPGVHARYLDERAQCMQVAAPEARKTCLREAGAAEVEARRGTLIKPHENYAQNRLARCNYYSDAQQRSWCERRMRGEGTVSGSVEQGAIVRQLVVTVPATD